MNLTKREKLLLSVLGIVIVITVYAVFLLLPLYRQFTANQAELKSQKELHETMELTAARYGTNDKALADAKKAAEEKLNKMLPTQANDKLHDYLVTLAEESGLKVRTTTLIDTTIQMVYPEYPEEVEVDPEIPTTYTLKDALFAVNGIELPVATFPMIYDVYMEKNIMSIEVSGDNQQVSAFLESIIAQNKTMKTIGFSRDAKNNTYTITVSVYSTEGME